MRNIFKTPYPYVIIGLVVFYYGVKYYNSVVAIQHPTSDTSSITNSSIAKIRSRVYSEKVHVDKSNDYAYVVKGLVRNNESRPVKGYVKIKFLNSTGDVLYNTETRVNGGDLLSSGQAGSFEYFTKPENFKDVIDFKVIFVEQK